MLTLAARAARSRISSMIALAMALLGGLSLITATGVIVESGLRSHATPDRLGGADIVVTADQVINISGNLPVAFSERRRLPEKLVSDLAELPGVTHAVGDISFPASIIGPQDHVVYTPDPQTSGHGWSSVGLLADPTIIGSAPHGPEEVAIGQASAATAGIQPGDQIRITVAGQPVATFRLSAVLPGDTDGLFFADATAQHFTDSLSRTSTVDLIGLKVAPGAIRSVAAAVRLQASATPVPVAVLDGAERGDASSPTIAADRGLLLLLAASLSGLILMIIAFVVAGASAVAMSGQRRELALLRAVGATPRQLRRLVSAQASVVALATAAPGLALGYFLSAQLQHVLLRLNLLPAALPLTIGPLPGLAAISLLVVLVQVTTRTAAWKVSRMPPTEAVTESASEPRSPSLLRTRAGVLLIVAAITLSVTPLLIPTEIGAAATTTSGILAAIGLAMAGPRLVSRAGQLLANRLSPHAAASTWLATANLRVYAQRFAGAISALALAVTFALTWGLTQTTVLSAATSQVRVATIAQQRLTASTIGGLPANLVAAVAGLPGVEGVASSSNTSVTWSHRELGDTEATAEPAIVLGASASTVLDLGVTAGDINLLAGNTVAISSDAARSRHAPLGTTVNLLLDDGTPVQARVIAIYDRSLGFGAVALSHDLMSGHTTSGLDQSILVRTDSSVQASNALTALVESTPGTTIQATHDNASGTSSVPAGTWLNLAAISVLLAYLLLNVANKIVAATTQRAREIAILRLVGATTGQIKAMMRREATAVAGSAIASGLALSALPLAFLSIGFLSRPWPAGPVLIVPATAGVIFAVAFLAIEVPTRFALRRSPLEAVQS